MALGDAPLRRPPRPFDLRRLPLSLLAKHRQQNDVVGWSIDSSPTSSLVTSALWMAIGNRRPTNGTVIHSDHGTQFTSWAFTH
jgi:transposase InsO family protein